MKRKMIGAAAAYMSGLFFASFFTDISGLIMIFGAGLAVFAAGKRRGFSRGDFIMTAVCFITAFAVNKTYTKLCCEPVKAYDGSSGSFTGRVIDVDTYDNDFAVYTLRGSINGETAAKIQLSTNELDASIGDVLTAECSFSVPVNTYIFRAEDYCRSRHIFITASAEGEVLVTHTGSGKIRTAIREFREMTISRFIRRLGTEDGGFLAGMVFGEKEHISDSMKTSLYRSGIGHILAVSGLHVSIIAFAVMGLLRYLKVNRYICYGAMNAVMLLLIALANYPVSALRAAVMLDILNAAPLFRQQNDSLNSLSIAALLICLFDPYALMNSGFILSLAGTFGAAVLGPSISEKYSTKRMKSAAIAVCTAAAVFPFCLYFYDEASVISPLTNLLLVPLCSLAMLIGLIDTVTLGLLNILPAAGVLIRFVTAFSESAASTGFAHIPRIGDAVPVLLLIAAAVTVMMYLFTGSRRKTAVSAGISMLVCGMLYFSAAVMQSKLCTVTILGRGTDAAAVISYGSTADIVDMSGHHSTDEYVRKYIAVSGKKPGMLILAKKSDSRYSAYMETLSADPPENFLTADNYKGSYAFMSGECRAELSGECLSVSRNGNTVNIMPGDGQCSSGLNVFYGSAPDGSCNCCIYLDSCDTQYSGMNNIEIILSEDGRYIIRSL